VAAPAGSDAPPAETVPGAAPPRRRRRGSRGGRGRRREGREPGAPGTPPPEDIQSEAPTQDLGSGAAAAPSAPDAGPARRAEPSPSAAPAVDQDGWPVFGEPALPEEEVRPEDEPATEEIPTLDARDLQGRSRREPRGPDLPGGPGDAAGFDRGPRADGATGDDRRGRRRRRRRGRRGGGFDGAAPGPGGPEERDGEPGFPAEETIPAVEPIEESLRDEAPRDERLRDERPRDDHSRADRPSGERPRGGRPREDRLRRETPRDAAPAHAHSNDERRGDAHAHTFFRPERLEACQRAIGYWFRDITLLENALTHSSIKSDDRPSYERMEFLGDSVVGLIISKYLYDWLPDCDEGDLTKLKSIVVSTEGLANAAQAIGLDRFLAVGRGLLMKNEVPRSLIADVFEGVAGAVFLDRGYEAAQLYTLDHLRPYIEEAHSGNSGAKNFKSVLQQVAQRDLGETPHYDVLREWGPGHTREFEVVAVLGRRRFPAGKAPTKREAEQKAALLAIQTIALERGSSAMSPRRREHQGERRGHGGGGRRPRRRR
jgi:ribonuclease-3